MSEAKLEAYFFTTVFIGVLVLVGLLLYPFLGSLALAMVLATLGMPLYDHVRKVVKSDAMAALIVVLVITLAVLLPAVGLFFLLIDEVRGAVQYLSTTGLHNLPGFLAACQAQLNAFFPFLSVDDLTKAILSGIQGAGSNLLGLLANTAGAFFKLFLAVIALFYFLKDGHRFVKLFIKLSPLTDNEDELIVRKLKGVTRSLIRGQLVIACLQGLLTGTGLLMFGVPNPVLWGTVAAIASLIPTVGTGAVNIPSIIYLIVTGQYAAAIGLTAWAVLIVGTVDNIIGPKVVGSYAKIHPLFMLLSVLGGIAFFGLAGFLLGPLLFGLLVVLAEIYQVKIKQMHSGAH